MISWQPWKDQKTIKAKRSRPRAPVIISMRSRTIYAEPKGETPEFTGGRWSTKDPIEKGHRRKVRRDAARRAEPDGG